MGSASPEARRPSRPCSRRCLSIRRSVRELFSLHPAPGLAILSDNRTSDLSPSAEGSGAYMYIAPDLRSPLGSILKVPNQPNQPGLLFQTNLVPFHIITQPLANRRSRISVVRRKQPTTPIYLYRQLSRQLLSRQLRRQLHGRRHRFQQLSFQLRRLYRRLFFSRL
jgi:hypothetical protein